MARLLLDTTVLIDVLRGSAGTVERLRGVRDAGDVPLISAINVEEIYRGLRSAERAAAERLFGGLTVVAIGHAEGRQAGVWRAHFAERGLTLHQADCLIAAAAASSGATLATGNPRDFPMDEVTVDHWPVGR